MDKKISKNIFKNIPVIKEFFQAFSFEPVNKPIKN